MTTRRSLVVALTAVAAALSACKSNKNKPVTEDDVDPVQIVEFSPVPDDQRPVIRVVVTDTAGGQNVQRIEFTGFGASAGGAPTRPTSGQLEYRIMSALNSTGRVRVLSVDTARRLKGLKDEGLLPDDSPDAKLLTPQFELECRILDCDQVAGSSKTKSFAGVGLGKGETISVVRIAFTVTALRGGMVPGFQGEAAGKQKSTSRSTSWNVGFFGSDSQNTTTPTFDEAIKKCVFRLTEQVVSRINPQPTAAPEATTTPAGQVGEAGR